MKKLVVLFLSATFCFTAFADSIRVCVTQDSTQDGRPDFALIYNGYPITEESDYLLGKAGSCEDIPLVASHAVFLNKPITVEIDSLNINTVTFSQTDNFQNCSVTILYNHFTGVTFDAHAEIGCTSKTYHLDPKSKHFQSKAKPSK